MQKRSFGRTKEGREVTEYTLVNAQGMTLSVIDLGATIVSITMKGSDGNVYDVVLGYDTPVDYQNNTCYFGAVIGRNANRIDHAHIHLDGKDYSLEANDNENNLHSGSHGFHAVIWDVVQESAQSITFSYVSRDGEQDFPGNMTRRLRTRWMITGRLRSPMRQSATRRRWRTLRTMPTLIWTDMIPA